MKRSLLITAIVWLITSLNIMAQTGQPRESASPKTESRQSGEAAPLIFWNRKITVFRANYEHLSPAQRAANAEARIEALPEVAPEWRVEANEAFTGRYTGVLFTVNGQYVFGLMQEDLDPESGETLKDAADYAVAQLHATLDARSRQRNWSVLLRAIGLSIAATLIALFGILLVIRGGRKGLSRLEMTSGARVQPLTIAGINLQPMAVVMRRGAIKLTVWAAGITLAYLWLTFVLTQFPYSHPWGEQLGTFLINLFGKLGSGALQAIPGIFTVLVIFLFTRIAVRLIDGIFREVEERRQSTAWLHPDTAGATRRLIVVLIWIFALIVAYPYIPGSSTDAFKGVSVFVGLHDIAWFGGPDQPDHERLGGDLLARLENRGICSCW